MERKTEQLKNVALLAHVSSGKTSLAEAMLLNGKSTNRLGRVDDGSSNMDYEPEEIKRKITISTSFHHFDWKKYYVNIIDTPGDDNFLSDSKGALQAADGAVIVIDATAGVKIGTEKVWQFVTERNIPKIIFVNKMDKERADFYKVVEEVNKAFDIKITPVFLPVGAEDKFSGVVDMIKMKAFISAKDGSGKSEQADIPADMADTLEEWREQMIENTVEANDELMEKYLEGQELDPKEIEKTFYEGVKSGQIIPVLCGSATGNIGVTQLMDIIVQGFPGPSDGAAKEGKKTKSDEIIKRRSTEDEPFSALVFKTLADPFAGKLSIIKVISGTVDADSTVYNSTKETKEKLGSLYIMEGKKQQAVDKAIAGDIIALAKLRETMTGDTLCIENNPIIYKATEPLRPVISYAVEARNAGAEDKLYSSLVRLLEEDPTLRLERDQTTADIIVSGTGQIHLETTCEKLNRKFGVEVNLKPVKVPYRETIKKAAKGIVYRHKKQSGGRGQFAEVHFDLFPKERGEGFEFDEALVGMNVPRNFVPAVEKGLHEAIVKGSLAGFPVVDLRVRFYDGKSHEVDSSEMAFKIAALMCFRKGVEEATPILLEPIMKLEVIVPEEYMGDVMGDLNSRRGRVLGMDSEGKYQVIKAQAPMSEILKYALDLNAITAGRGSFRVEHSHYDEVPASLMDKVIAEHKKEAEEE
ncbi:MAG: elongation factor G [Deltaproteobacteria bacterium]|nr:elongation factor G [Deltaproteobacteria bacterium]